MSENPGYIGVGPNEVLQGPQRGETSVEEHVQILRDVQKGTERVDISVHMAGVILPQATLNRTEHPGDHGYHV